MSRTVRSGLGLALAALLLVLVGGSDLRWFSAIAQTGGEADAPDTPDADQPSDEEKADDDDRADQRAEGEDQPGDQADARADDPDDDADDIEETAEAEPDAATKEKWYDPPVTVYELRAVQVDADNYVETCADKAACQKTVRLVVNQLASLLTDYRRSSSRQRKEAGPSLGRSLKGTTKYRVLEGQRLELAANRPGPNDAAIWSEVTRVIPRAQSDKYVSRFHVFRKRSDDTLAYTEGDPETEKFILGINEPRHLGTDLREQYLTVAHEFMHMVVFEQFIGPESFDENEKAKAKGIFSLENILNALFAPDKPAAVQNPQSQTAANCNGIADSDGCFPKGTIFYDFTSRFWTKSDLEHSQEDDFYEKNGDRFVTGYATTSPHEDISESFSWWVINEGKGKTVADAKQRFFGRYPQLVALKAQIRRAVIADILKAEQAQ